MAILIVLGRTAGEPPFSCASRAKRSNLGSRTYVFGSSSRRAIFILGSSRRASFTLGDSCSSYIFCDRRRRANFILVDWRKRASFIWGDSSRNYILGNRRRASFILGDSSRKYILGDRRKRAATAAGTTSAVTTV